MESGKLFKSLIETDISFRCIAATLVATMLLVSVSSCTNTEESAVDTSFSYASDEDIEHKMFSSASVTVPDTAKDVNTIFEYDGKVCLIRKAFDYSDETAYITVYNTDGSLDSSYEIKCGRALEFCCLGKELACYSGNIMEPEIGIDVYDWDGELIRHNSISRLLVGDLWITRSVALGNVICGTEGAVLIDANADVIATVKYDEFMNIEGFVAEGDKYYVLGRTADAQVTEYYELDFDKGICSRIASWEDLGGSFSTEEAIESDTYNGHIYDVDKGYIYRADIGSYSIVPVAKLDNMLVQPPKCALTTTYYLHILTDDLYCWYYPYDNGVSELVIISPDDDLDLEERQELVVKGVGIEDDALLKYAAYVYNSSQEEYIVRLKDLGVSYSNAREAQSAMLRVMSEFENGDIPDIFYGPIFDYQYWGDNGMVIDMSPYLKDEISDGKIIPNIRQLMQNDDGKIYQVFAGFALWGFWGRSSQYGDNSYSYDNMPALYEDQSRTGPLYACDIADMIIRYKMRYMYENGKMISEEELSDIISYSIENGYGPDEQLSVAELSDVGAGIDSLYLGYLTTMIQMRDMERSFGDVPSYVGIPSTEGSVHMVYPWGQVAVSSGTEHPEACCDFIRVLLSEDVQDTVPFSSEIPVNAKIWAKYLSYMADPDTIPAGTDDSGYSLLAGYSPFNEDESDVGFSDGVIGAYMDAVTSADTVMSFDWGLYNIICEEVNSYYRSGKSVSEIVSSLSGRIEVYVNENY